MPLRKVWNRIFGHRPAQEEIGAPEPFTPPAVKPKTIRHKRLSCGHCATDCKGTTAHTGRLDCRICKATKLKARAKA